MRLSVLIAMALGLLFCLGQPGRGEEADAKAPAAAADATPANCLAEIEKAAQDDKYLFVLFKKEEDDNTTAMREVLTSFVKDRQDLRSVEIDVTAESEKEAVSKYQLAYAPMPLLLAIAPNGAVTGGFPVRVSAESLKDTIVSSSTAKCLKGFQDQKLVFVCIQNEKSDQAKEAMQGVKDFAKDPRFAKDTLVIKVDPTDEGEGQLLTDLDVDPQSKEPVTVFFVPPGRFVGEFRGATDADELVQTLVAAMYGGCGSCGPGGCDSCGPEGCDLEGCELEQESPSANSTDSQEE